MGIAGCVENIIRLLRQRSCRRLLIHIPADQLKVFSACVLLKAAACIFHIPHDGNDPHARNSLFQQQIHQKAPDAARRSGHHNTGSFQLLPWQRLSTRKGQVLAVQRMIIKFHVISSFQPGIPLEFKHGFEQVQILFGRQFHIPFRPLGKIEPDAVFHHHGIGIG